MTVYQIKRASMFFAASEYVSYRKLNEYFTAKAISIMMKDGFIHKLDPKEATKVHPSQIKDVFPIR